MHASPYAVREKRGLTDPLSVSCTWPTVSEAFCWTELRVSFAESMYVLSPAPVMVAGCELVGG